jgi:hypothetical protein
MPVKTGDTVTLSANPQIPLDRFHNLKPFASLSRVVGENVNADLDDMQTTLRTLVMRALAVEIECLSDASGALGGGCDIDKLAEYLLREFGYGQVRQTVSIASSAGTAGKAAGAAVGASSAPPSIASAVGKAIERRGLAPRRPAGK